MLWDKTRELSATGNLHFELQAHTTHDDASTTAMSTNDLAEHICT